MALEDTVKPTEMRLLERALRERWPFTPEHRKRAINTVLLIMYGRDEKGQPKKTSDRIKLSAVRVMAMLDSLNIEAAKEILPQQHVHLHGGIDMDKIPTDELKRIEAELIRLTQGA